MKKNKHKKSEQEKQKQDNIEQIDSAAEEKTADTAQEAEEQVGQEACDDMAAKLEQQQAKTNEYHDLLLRTRAEFDNYRKRTLRENTQKMKYANESLLLDILQVIDNFERALMTAQSLEDAHKDEGDVIGFVQGIRLTYKQLLDFLNRNGVERIETQDASFDPHFHEAVDFVETDEMEEDMIVASLQTGYMIADRVLRPACVRVAKAPVAPVEEAQQETDTKEPETAESNG